jgi:hypothetical protein
MNTLTRTLRLTAATAVALVLMTAVAQARPLTGNGPAEKVKVGQAYAGTYQPAAPANNVVPPDRADRIGVSPRVTPLGNVPDRVDRIGTGQQSPALRAGSVAFHHATATNDGFDWTAAGIGAGTAFAIVLVAGAAGMSIRGRRGVALSS